MLMRVSKCLNHTQSIADTHCHASSLPVSSCSELRRILFCEPKTVNPQWFLSTKIDQSLKTSLPGAQASGLEPGFGTDVYILAVPGRCTLPPLARRLPGNSGEISHVLSVSPVLPKSSVLEQKRATFLQKLGTSIRTSEWDWREYVVACGWPSKDPKDILPNETCVCSVEK